MVNGYQYQYDQDNRLTQLKDSSAVLVAEFTYDALGRRIEVNDLIASQKTRCHMGNPIFYVF